MNNVYSFTGILANRWGKLLSKHIKRKAKCNYVFHGVKKVKIRNKELL